MNYRTRPLSNQQAKKTADVKVKNNRLGPYYTLLRNRGILRKIYYYSHINNLG